MVQVILIVEDPTVTVKCRTTIKVLFIYFNWCLSVMLDSVSCSFTSILYLTNTWYQGLDRTSFMYHLLSNAIFKIFEWGRVDSVDINFHGLLKNQIFFKFMVLII